MGAVANIALYDAAGSPVLHTFIPIDYDAKSGAWWFEDQTGTNAIGFNRISLQLSKPLPPAPGTSSKDRVIRVKLTIHTPSLETLGTNDAGITPAPTVAYIPRVIIEFVVPERASLQQRKDIRKYAEKLIADAQVVSMIETLANIY